MDGRSADGTNIFFTQPGGTASPVDSSPATLGFQSDEARAARYAGETSAPDPGANVQPARGRFDDVRAGGVAGGRDGGRGRSLSDQSHVIVPGEVGSWIPVGLVGYFDVPDDVLAVHGNVVLEAQISGQFGRFAEHGIVGPGARTSGITFMFDADRGRVIGPVPGVPGDVLVEDTLGEFTFFRDTIVGADPRAIHLKVSDGSTVRTFDGMDDHLVDCPRASDSMVLRELGVVEGRLGLRRQKRGKEK